MLRAQNEMKGERGDPGLKGEKGEPGGGYYDPRYGMVGPPGERGPPVRSHGTNVKMSLHAQRTQSRKKLISVPSGSERRFHHWPTRPPWPTWSAR